MLVAYPKLLTDPMWKKVEQAAGVSGTGVGKTLRDAEKVWKTLADEVAGLEKGTVPAKTADTGKKAMIAAFKQTQTQLKALDPKIKKPEKKAIITEYAKVVEYLIRDLDQAFNLVNDHRGMDFVVSKFNDHVKADLTVFKQPIK